MQVLQYKVVRGSFVFKDCRTQKCWEVFLQALLYKVVLGGISASIVVQSNAGRYFVQALQSKVVLGSSLRKLCSTKKYWEVRCASMQYKQ